ncbi:SDR16C5 [Cordylochernes scorpioides]|uniref:SDR16C5 n=1 Tax=Cordylochernes scorpioides TaxID=51811 RepID=A0ABY6KZU5_9ARAC|nr:SDR16C5 [Cordylochernes scorpioides]
MDAKLAAGLLWTVYHLLEGLVLLLIPRWLRYKPIDGEVVLVTGSGSGLGRHLALRFARLGARLVLWDLSPEPNEETARLVRAAGGQAWAYSCDVSDREAVYRLAEQVRKDVPDPVSILVNNAGVVNGERLLATPDEAIIRTLQVNTMSHFWVSDILSCCGLDREPTI